MLLGGCAPQTMHEPLLGYLTPTEKVIHLKIVVLLVLQFCCGPGGGLGFVVRGLLWYDSLQNSTVQGKSIMRVGRPSSQIKGS